MNLDLSKRLGAGWTLKQGEGDTERQTWLVERDGAVRGLVHRYHH
ncbi:hypothetical protein GCM10009864_59930 [Streptomyces lunalinharesii]|uniref:Uncharacterized protein n=1 Tax=Streptomyces lunalinharesii TaxID=333384 RepID=A0ABP6EZC4_9ACTN